MTFTPHSDPVVATVVLIAVPVLGFLFSVYYAMSVAKVSLKERPSSARLMGGEAGDRDVMAKIQVITEAISTGAKSFLFAEYMYMFVFIVVFALVILLVLGLGTSQVKGESNWPYGIFTAISFSLGGLNSILSGYIGMRIAVYANGRTAVQAIDGYSGAFITAFKAGGVMGFALCSLAIIVAFISIVLFKVYYSSAGAHLNNEKWPVALYESIAGYGLGGSSIALFGRVGGGIYTKAADVGADLVGKVEQGIPEDDPRNPAVIADNVGDNVGDVAGMGADLFGSFAESTCAALVVASTSPDMMWDWGAMCFPLIISATGMVCCFFTTFVATHLLLVHEQKQIEASLKRQIIISTVLTTPALFGVAFAFLPAKIRLPNPNYAAELLTASGSGSADTDSVYIHSKNWEIAFCACCGLWSGMIIGYVTERYTSHSYGPVREVARACKTGAATNIIYGLALGYQSVIIPIFCLAITIYVSFSLAGMFGVACAALGILSTLAIGLTIDVYGPISDNAGGIAEMAGLGHEVRDRTDALDAAGNTTAAIGKGFAIGSAALVSLALFGAYVTRIQTVSEVDGIPQVLQTVNIMKAFPFAGLLVGAMLPYWFSAMTMKSVGKAALAMVEEVRRQFKDIPGLMEGEADPDYKRCVQISTQASLHEMLAPGALVMLTPLIIGFVFGVEALSGLLAGALVSGVQMAISASNTGGAWDNAKKFIEGGALGGKGSDNHKAAVIGDTVGDPLKDTSGPALNILMKLMAVESLVFSPFFYKINNGEGLVGYIH